jgi:ribosomal protein L11 methyltransferase
LIVCYPEELPTIKADVIIANILSGPLISLEPTLKNLIKPNGIIILSGLLEHEVPLILDVYQQHFNIMDITIQEQWARITASINQGE